MKASRRTLDVESFGRQRPAISNQTEVSSISRFADMEWDWSRDIGRPARINWGIRISDSVTLDDPSLCKISLALRQLYAALVLGWSPRSPRIGPKSVVTEFESILTFVRFLVIERGKRSFFHVVAEDLAAFDNDVESSMSSRSSKERIWSAVKRLWNEGEFIDEGLRLSSRYMFETKIRCGRGFYSGQQTKVIPDAILQEAWATALDYIDKCSDYLLAIRREHTKHLKGRHSQHVLWSNNAWSADDPHYSESRFASFICTLTPPKNSRVLSAGVRDLRHFYTEYLNLRRAALFVLGVVTGLRRSSLSTLKYGCLKSLTLHNGQTAFVVEGLLFKTGDSRGIPTRWVCGRFGAQAVHVLEKWGEWNRRWTKSELLISSLKFKPRKLGDSGHATIEAIQDIAIFFKCLPSPEARAWRFNPHQMRRTFVRLVCRHAGCPLTVLQGHLGHLSIRFTDYYLGNDTALWLEYFSELWKFTRQSIAEMFTQSSLAGSGGSLIQKELNEAINAGRLPKDFRGQAGEAIRLKLAEDFVRSGQTIYFLATNFCRFRSDRAHCNPGGERPMVHMCSPSGCKNAYIDKSHLPFWRLIEASTKNESAKFRRSVLIGPALRAQHAEAVAIIKKLSSSSGPAR